MAVIITLIMIFMIGTIKIISPNIQMCEKRQKKWQLATGVIMAERNDSGSMQNIQNEIDLSLH